MTELSRITWAWRYSRSLFTLPLKIISWWISPPPLWITLLFFFLSLQLHQISLEAKKKSNTDVQVQMVSYSAKLGYNHNGIHLDPDLMNVVGWVWVTLTPDARQSIKGTYHPKIKIQSLTLMCLESQARFRSWQNIHSDVKTGLWDLGLHSETALRS